MINNFSIFLSFQSLIWVARPMLRSLKRLTTQTVLVDPIVRPTTNPNDPPNGGISRFVISIIYNGSHTFQIGWIDSPHIGFCSRANENRWRRGGGRYWDAKDERQADGGRGGGLDDAYIRLKLIGIVPPADISYLPASSRGSLRQTQAAPCTRREGQLPVGLLLSQVSLT